MAATWILLGHFTQYGTFLSKVNYLTETRVIAIGYLYSIVTHVRGT